MTPAFTTLLDALAKLEGARNLYAVGGILRDLRLGRPPADLDLVCPPPAEPVARALAARLGGSLVILDDERRIFRIVPRGADYGSYVDLSERRGPDLETDLASRDFTINAMAVRLSDLVGLLSSASWASGEPAVSVLDPYGGADDTDRRVIRAVRPGVFAEDPLRILRAVRLAAELGFTVEPTTLTAARSAVAGLDRVAAERLRDELFRVLASDRAAPALETLNALGALERLIPELAPLKTPHLPHLAHLDLWTHSITTVVRLEAILAGLPSLFPAWPACPDRVARFEAHLAQPLEAGISRRAAIKFAALLHDVAKPETYSVSAEGEVHFFGHDEQGSRTVGEIARRLRTSVATQTYLERMTRYHLRPLLLAREARVTDRALYRFFRDTGQEAIDLLLHGLADAAAYDRDEQADLRLPNQVQLRETFDRMLRWQEARAAHVTAKPLVTGDDLIEVLGLTPGPQFGVILEDIREQQALGHLTTRDDALAYLRQHGAPRSGLGAHY